MSGYNEKHSVNVISIPINAEFSLPISEKINLYAAGGVKLGFVGSSKYETSIKSFETRGYYEQWNLELYDIAKYGFVNLNNIDMNGELDVKTNLSFTFDLGLKFDLGKDYDLYFGGFIDYGLTQAIKHDSYNSIFEYKMVNTSVNNPMYNNAVSNLNMFETGVVKSARLILTGVKLSFTIPIFKR